MPLQRTRLSKAARFNEIANVLIKNDFWGLLSTFLRRAKVERDARELEQEWAESGIEGLAAPELGDNPMAPFAPADPARAQAAAQVRAATKDDGAEPMHGASLDDARRAGAGPGQPVGTLGATEPPGRNGHSGRNGAAQASLRERRAADAPARIRAILEELGPTFIKLGQLMATRPDLVPAPFVAEFKKLYDRTPPQPWEDVRATLRSELGRDPEQVFAAFEREAIASASVGQVHRATLPDGTRVAVKVQHAGIEESMRLDFEILRGLVRFIEKVFAASRVWQPTAHLEELRQMLERELDYRFEMKNTQRVARNVAGDPRVRVPRVFPDLCTRRVLVMEFIEGVKFADVSKLDALGVDRPAVARAVTQSMARQIFIDRMFHADPSPGNILILPPDRVAFLDFGAIGIVTERRAKAMLRLITGIAKGDVEGASDAIIDLCDSQGELDHRKFQSDVEKILDFFEREEVSVADPRIMELILGLARTHKMLLPPDFMLITRALFQFDGFCRELDPDFDVVEVLEPFVAEVLWRNIANPTKQKELVEETFGELLRFARVFPHTLNTLVRKVERNELSTRVEIAGLEDLKRSQGRGVLKMAFTVVMASMVLGLAVVSALAPTRTMAFLFGAAVLVVVWALVLVVWSEAFKGRRD